MRTSRTLVAVAAVLLVARVAGAQGALAKPAAGSPTAENLPVYVIDPTWPPTNWLPNDWIFGDIRGLFVDDEDDLWVVHMPSSLTDQEIGAAVKPPIADCCHPAPAVVEMDQNGKVKRSWGSPETATAQGYTWPVPEHGIYMDHKGFMWIGTSGGDKTGHIVVKMTQDGKHVFTIGEPGVNKGSADTTHLGGPANFYVEPKTNEIFIADGYRNKRVIVYDAETGKYKRHWGAYGKVPQDDEKYTYPVKPDSPPQQYSTLHGLVGTKDGMIIVSDRRGNRIQMFDQQGKFIMERFVRPSTGGSGSGFSLQLSRDPEQSLLYLMDGTNMRIWVIRRKDLTVLDRFGRPGRQAGEFIRAHMIAIDSQNRMYTGEAGNGRRIQRWILKGTKPASSVQPPPTANQ